MLSRFKASCKRIGTGPVEIHFSLTFYFFFLTWRNLNEESYISGLFLPIFLPGKQSNMSYCSIRCLPASLFRSLPVFRKYTFSDVPTNLKGYKVQHIREKMGARSLSYFISLIKQGSETNMAKC